MPEEDVTATVIWYTKIMIDQFLMKLAKRDIFTIFCTLAAIGIIGLIYDLCLLIKRKIFGEKYLSKYEEWMYSSLSDDERCKCLRRWMHRNSNRINDEIEGTSRIDFYRSYSKNQATLERHIGRLGYLISKKLWKLINPFAWLTRSVRWMLIDAPLWILCSVGVINVNRKNSIKNHSLSDEIIRLIAFLGALASIVSLVFLLSEWDPLMKFLNRIFG